jgi:hypothetical protein
MVTRLAIVVLLMTATPVHAGTWLGNDEIIGHLHARDGWMQVGAGLSLRQDVVPRLSIAAELAVLRIDADGHDDDRHGFGFHGAAVARVVLAGLPDVELRHHDIFTLELEAGAATTTRYGIGADLRSGRELLVGLRLAYYAAAFDPKPGAARAIGGHLGFRYARGDAESSVTFVLGYEWGL